MLDKKWPIRHQAIMNVARLYKEINSKKDPSKIKQVAWMPNKVLHTYYQNTSQVNCTTVVYTSHFYLLGFKFLILYN